MISFLVKVIVVAPLARPFTSIRRSSGSVAPVGGTAEVMSQPHFSADTSRGLNPIARSAAATASIASCSMRERASGSMLCVAGVAAGWPTWNKPAGTTNAPPTILGVAGTIWRWASSS